MESDIEELGLAVKRVQWRHHRELDRRLTAIGGSLAQWDAVRQIDRHPDASMHVLAQATFQSDQSFGTLVARLIDRGFVERVPGPGRARRHRLTSRGRRLLEDGRDVAGQILGASFAALDAEERGVLLALLRRVDAAGATADP